MKNLLSILALLILAPILRAQSPIPATDPNARYIIAGQLAASTDLGLFIQKLTPSAPAASRSASVGAGGPVAKPSGQLTSSPGIPEIILLTAHPEAARFAERDRLAAEIQYTGVTRYQDREGNTRTIHTYRFLAARSITPTPTPAPKYQNPLEQKPKRAR